MGSCPPQITIGDDRVSAANDQIRDANDLCPEGIALFLEIFGGKVHRVDLLVLGAPLPDPDVDGCGPRVQQETVLGGGRASTVTTDLVNALSRGERDRIERASKTLRDQRNVRKGTKIHAKCAGRKENKNSAQCINEGSHLYVLIVR